MICPICKKGKIRCMSPYWHKGKTIDACCDCAKELKLNPLNVRYKKDGKTRYPFWKVQIPATPD